jgi:hypothetical protein
VPNTLAASLAPSAHPSSRPLLRKNSTVRSMLSARAFGPAHGRSAPCNTNHTRLLMV